MQWAVAVHAGSKTPTHAEPGLQMLESRMESGSLFACKPLGLGRIPKTSSLAIRLFVTLPHLENDGSKETYMFNSDVMFCFYGVSLPSAR